MRANELLLVVVPYRDRRDHLASFMARVWRPLREEHPNSRLIVAEQSPDGRRFNRGALLNAALHWYRDNGGKRPARVLLHDVDLEPAPARPMPPDAGAAARLKANRALLDRRFYTAFKPPRRVFKKRKARPANATLAT